MSTPLEILRPNFFLNNGEVKQKKHHYFSNGDSNKSLTGSIPHNLKPLIVILGPTASGKSEIAVRLARKFNGEIISADSRQVYKGMDIGTGKITKKEMRGIPHYLLDIASPKRKFTVAQYQKRALRAIKRIQQKNKVPIIVGGTGFYIDAVIKGPVIPKVKPDWRLRASLEKLTTDQLSSRLKKIDPIRARGIDKKNRRRLIRALEIVIKTKKPVPTLKKKQPPFDILTLGIKRSRQELKKLIKTRLSKRLKKGMVAEVKRLRKSGVSWKRLEEFGLEYRWIGHLLQGKINREELIEKLQKEIQHYTKRQMTWFRRNKKTHWVKNYKEAKTLVGQFLF